MSTSIHTHIPPIFCTSYLTLSNKGTELSNKLIWEFREFLNCEIKPAATQSTDAHDLTFQSPPLSD